MSANDADFFRGLAEHFQRMAQKATAERDAAEQLRAETVLLLDQAELRAEVCHMRAEKAERKLRDTWIGAS